MAFSLISSSKVRDLPGPDAKEIKMEAGPYRGHFSRGTTSGKIADFMSEKQEKRCWPFC